MKQHYKKQFIHIAFLLLVIMSNIVSADTQNTASAHVWNLQNADISSVIDEVSKETGKTFILDPKVTGKLSIVSSKPLNSKEVYQVFVSSLHVLGYSVVPTGTKNVYKVLPVTKSGQAGVPVSNMYKPGSGDQLVASVIPIKNVPADKLVPALRPMLPSTANLSVYKPTNSLIVLGTANNLTQLKKIISDVDKANTRGVEVLQLKNANADDIAGVVAGIFNNSDEKDSITIEADDHTNSLLVNGNLSARLRVRAIVSQLDRQAPPGFSGNTQVIQLHYQQAKNLAKVLENVIKASQNKVGKKNSADSAIAIEAEPATNSLIISAPPTMMHNLRNVIKRLDDKPAQVLVEAAIVEVDEGKMKQLGVQWGTYQKEGLGQNSSNQHGGSSALFSGGTTPQKGFNLGVGVIKNGDFREIISMLSNDLSTNILSTPSVVVLDNQTAKIQVGKTLSIQTGSYANSSNVNTVEPFNTFDRQDIGLHLFVTPQISRDNAVQLTIDQGNQTLEDPSNPGTTPVTNNTSLKTSVLVNNNDILVLGGLISNTLAKSTNKIPIVGDIPGIGHLFQYKSTVNEKRNLMIFLKPIILNKRKSNIYVTGKKYNYMRNQQSISRNGGGKKLTTPNMLPTWQKDVELPSPF